jgi:hypothetical protein
VEINGIVLAGAAGGGTVTIGLPSGLTIDPDKVPSNGASDRNLYGSAQWFNNGSQFAQLTPVQNSTTVFSFRVEQGAIAAGSLIAGTDLASSDSIAFNVQMPVAEWSTSALLSTTDTLFSTSKVKYNSNASQSIANTGSQVIVNFEDVVFDDQGLVTVGAGWAFTAPKTATYNIYAGVEFEAEAWTAGDVVLLEVYVDAVSVQRLSIYEVEVTSTQTPYVGGSTLVQLNKGQALDIRVAHDRTGGAALIAPQAIRNQVSIHELPDFSTFSVHGQSEYLSVSLAANFGSSLNANQYEDVTGMSLSLTPGKWEIGYSIMFGFQTLGGNAVMYANAAITDSSDNVINGTLGGQFDNNLSSTSLRMQQCSISTEITVTSSDTYKLRVRQDVASTLGNMRVFGENQFGVLTNPDCNSVLWARRIS